LYVEVKVRSSRPEWMIRSQLHRVVGRGLRDERVGWFNNAARSSETPHWSVQRVPITTTNTVPRASVSFCRSVCKGVPHVHIVWCGSEYTVQISGSQTRGRQFWESVNYYKKYYFKGTLTFILRFQNTCKKCYHWKVIQALCKSVTSLLFQSKRVDLIIVYHLLNWFISLCEFLNKIEILLITFNIISITFYWLFLFINYILF